MGPGVWEVGWGGVGWGGHLGGVLGRPAVVPAPAIALRAAFGRGMVNELLLSSQRVRSEVLQHEGFSFKFPTLGAALADLLSS